MPALAVAVVAAAASAGVAAWIGGTIGLIVGSIVGSVIAYGLSAALGLNKAPKSNLSTDQQDRMQTVRSPIAAQRVVYGKARVAGTLVYAGSSGDDSRYMHMVLALAGHRIRSIGNIWIGDDLLTPDLFDGSGAVVSGTYKDKVIIRRYLGDQTAADAGLIAAIPSDWDGNHVGFGIAYLYVRLEYDQNLFSGIPNVTAEVDGKADIVDPRLGTTSYSNNPALCIRDYLMSPLGLGCTADEIDDGFFAVAANICDEPVQVAADGSVFQVRYSLDGSFTLDQQAADIMEDLLTSCLGTLVYVQGRYRLHVAAYDPPSDTLTADDLAGPVSVTTRPDLADLFNGVQGTFVSPDHFYQATDFPQMQDGSMVVDDGEEIWRDVEWPYTIDVIRAQRLSRILLRREREALTITATVRYAGIRYSAWQTLAVTLDEFGWSAKPFRVYGWKFDPVVGTIELTLREDTAYSYAWLYDAAEALGPAANTNFVNPLNVPAPTSLGVTPTTAQNNDGAIVPALLVTWVAALSVFVTAYEIQWRLSGGDWQGAQVAAGTQRYTISPVIVGQVIDVRVRSLAGLAVSAWTGTVPGTGQPDTTPPGNCTAPSVIGAIKQITIRWSNPPDSDLNRVEIAESTAFDISIAASVGNSFTTFFVRQLDAGESRHFWVRPIDRTGNAGNWTYCGYGTARAAATDDIQMGAVTGLGVDTWSGSFSGLDWTEIMDVAAGDTSFSSNVIVNADVTANTLTIPYTDGSGNAAAFTGSGQMRILVNGTVVRTSGSSSAIWAGFLPAGVSSITVEIMRSAPPVSGAAIAWTATSAFLAAQSNKR